MAARLTTVLLLVFMVGSLFGLGLDLALGAALFIALPEYLRIAREWRLVIFGAALVLMTLLMPRGMAGMIDMLATRLSRPAAPVSWGPLMARLTVTPAAAAA